MKIVDKSHKELLKGKDKQKFMKKPSFFIILGFLVLLDIIIRFTGGIYRTEPLLRAILEIVFLAFFVWGISYIFVLCVNWWRKKRGVIESKENKRKNKKKGKRNEPKN